MRRLAPHEVEVARLDEVPQDLVADMAAQGLFGYSIPEQYGGAGMTTEELVLAAMELSQCSVAFRARVGTNTGIGSEALVADGTDEQKARYLPRLASGELTGCFALTEPQAGSDATALLTTAARDGTDYVLNGEKCFITNAPLAGLFTVMARTDPDAPGRQRHHGLHRGTRHARPARPDSPTTRWPGGLARVRHCISRTAACRPPTSSAARKAWASRPR